MELDIFSKILPNQKDKPLHILFFHREKVKLESKAINTKVDDEADDRRKELASMKNQIQKEREELRGQLERDNTMVLKQLEKDSGDIMGLIKKERTDR